MTGEKFLELKLYQKNSKLFKVGEVDGTEYS